MCSSDLKFQNLTYAEFLWDLGFVFVCSMFVVCLVICIPYTYRLYSKYRCGWSASYHTLIRDVDQFKLSPQKRL